MQLGEWVEFEQIVGKARTTGGTQPVVQRLRRKRRGMVIGQSWVYDVQAGNPPVLAKRQPVLLVGVSLHRCYRVFPGDARLAAPPRTRKQSVPAPALSVARVNNAPRTERPPLVLPTGGTLNIPFDDPNRTRQELALFSATATLVRDRLTEHLRKWTPFATCSIRLDVLDMYPNVTILHEDVRRTIHALMEPIIADDHYWTFPSPCGQTGHICYMPA